MIMLDQKEKLLGRLLLVFSGEYKEIEIIRSNGEILNDVRPLVRFNVSVVLEKKWQKRNWGIWNWWETIL